MGIRLQPITFLIPKCLVKVHNASILERQIQILNQFDFEKILIVVGFKSELIIEHVKSLTSRIPIEFINNMNYKMTNNMVSLYMAKKELIHKEFLLLNGDTIFEEEIIKNIINQSGPVAPYDSHNFDPEELKLKILNQKAHSIIGKNLPDHLSDGSTIGIFKFTVNDSYALFADMESIIQSGNLNEWFEKSLSNIFMQFDFYPLDISGNLWMEIDNNEDLQKAHTLFKSISSQK